LRAFFHESFQAMRDRGTRALILDLRDNGGGEDELGKLLVSYLLDEPFRYYDDLVLNARWFDFFKYTPTFHDSLGARGLERRPDGTYRAVAHPNWGLQPTSAPTFDGSLFVLIDGGSFSTTSEFLSVVRDRRRGVFVGEESGGGYYGNSSGVVPNVILPNSHVAVKVPLLTYYMAVHRTAPAAHGVIPDFPVAHTIEDLLARRDPDMALALELARKAVKETALRQ
jgi:C-terminal processing protease CtpA/Prc